MLGDLSDEFRAMRETLDGRQRLASKLNPAWSRALNAAALPAVLRELEQLLSPTGTSLRALPATTPAERAVSRAAAIALDGDDAGFITFLSAILDAEHPFDIVEAFKRAGAQETDLGDGRKGYFGWVAPGSELEGYMQSPPLPAPPAFNIGKEMWEGLCKRIAQAVGLEFQGNVFIATNEIAEPAIAAAPAAAAEPVGAKPINAITGSTKGLILTWKYQAEPCAYFVGFEYIVILLGSPNEEISCLDLLRRVNPESPTSMVKELPEEPVSDAYGIGPQRGTGAPVDEEAKASVRKDLDDLEAEIEEARQRADVSAQERLLKRRAELAAYLQDALNIYGRDRDDNSERERARGTVCAAIRRALAAVKAAHPSLAEHLGDVRLGDHCVYRPKENVAWDLSILHD